MIALPAFISNMSITGAAKLFYMKNVDVLVIANFSLIFGVAGLLWPEKFLTLFDTLMFPWPASFRTVRANSVAAIVLSLLLTARLLMN